MRTHHILPVSKANGPGSRFVVWVQGCSRRCPGCFNPQTHDPDEGHELTVREVINQIPFTEVWGITVSGGEPFEQPGELALLLEKAGQKGLNRLVYTGFTYEELVKHENHTVKTCLSMIDTLIDGAYLKGLPPYLPWTGSGNQRVLQLYDGKIQKIYEKNDFETEEMIAGEVIIDRNGDIVATGIIDAEMVHTIEK